MFRSRVARVTMLVSAILSPPAYAQGYTVATVDVPFGVPGVDLAMMFLTINNAGVITAQYQVPPCFCPAGSPGFFEGWNAAILGRGEWTIINVPGSVKTGPTNPNQRGQVGLSYAFPDGVWHVAIWHRGALTNFPDVPGYPGGMIVNGLNDREQITGGVIDGAGIVHGFLGDAGAFTVFSFPAPGVIATVPFSTNNAGLTVGFYLLSDLSFHGFMYDGVEFANIVVPGGTDAMPSGINNGGQIVGSYVNSTGQFLGFLLDNGAFTDFQVPGASFTSPTSINDHGQISGTYGDSAGVAHGFVATPVP